MNDRGVRWFQHIREFDFWNIYMSNQFVIYFFFILALADIMEISVGGSASGSCMQCLFSKLIKKLGGKTGNDINPYKCEDYCKSSSSSGWSSRPSQNGSGSESWSGSKPTSISSSSRWGGSGRWPLESIWQNSFLQHSTWIPIPMNILVFILLLKRTWNNLRNLSPDAKHLVWLDIYQKLCLY